MLDKDKDDKLSRAEYEAGFDLFDFDSDGFNTKDELNGGVDPNFSFDSLDGDGDDNITKEE
jgi:hypothetical protein